jgi:hypothetical protein
MFDGAPISARTRPGARPCPVADGSTRVEEREAALRGLAEALLIAAVSPAVPGIAHLRAGFVRLGSALLTVQALALTGAVAVHLDRSPAARPPAGSAWTIAAAAGWVVVAALWAALIVHSYAVLVPDGLPPLLRLAGGTTVSVLCLLVIVPPLTAARSAVPAPSGDRRPAPQTRADSISLAPSAPDATPARMRSTLTQPLPGSARP